MSILSFIDEWTRSVSDFFFYPKVIVVVKEWRTELTMQPVLLSERIENTLDIVVLYLKASSFYGRVDKSKIV